MTQATSPPREKFFANDYLRDMFASRAAGEITSDACLLLAVIAVTQDATRYRRRGVTFFNSELVAQCGFSESTLDRARKRAVEAGWLHYEEGEKRRPGVYWVLDPEKDSSFCRQAEDKTEDKSGEETMAKEGSLLPLPERHPNTHTARAGVTPSLADVREYFEAKHFKAPPEKFHAHFSANGWTQPGGRKIVDWRAQADKFEMDEPKHARSKGKHDGRPGTNRKPARRRSRTTGGHDINADGEGPIGSA